MESDINDKYRCLKLPITSILPSNDGVALLDKLHDAIRRSNVITTKTYFLLRLWVLHKYHDGIDIPVITEDTIRTCMKSIKKPSRGPKPKKDNLLLLDEFNSMSPYEEKEDGCNLSTILQYYRTTMLTAIENNIKMHFFSYMKRYINSYFNSPTAIDLYYPTDDSLTDDERKKQYKRDLILLKKDIIRM